MLITHSYSPNAYELIGVNTNTGHSIKMRLTFFFLVVMSSFLSAVLQNSELVSSMTTVK